MAKNDNLHDFLVDIADAIREKTGTTDLINPQDFSDKIKSIKGSENSEASVWTGHADVEGLKAIGWTDEDIEYYQQYGVNWNAEDDKYHLVSDENKAMYGVINADNIADFANELVYLPKIDTSGRKLFTNWLLDCKALVSIPMIDTSSATSVKSMFENCYALYCVPLLDFSNVTDISRLFYNCYSINNIPLFNTSKATNWSYFSRFAYSLRMFPELDTSASTNFNYTFSNCVSLSLIKPIVVSSGTAFNGSFSACPYLQHLFLKGLTKSIGLTSLTLLTKESLLYMINNASLTAFITISLSSYCYAKYAEDADILEALSNHPAISLASE